MVEKDAATESRVRYFNGDFINKEEDSVDEYFMERSPRDIKTFSNLPMG
jgi:hypothetical protein